MMQTRFGDTSDDDLLETHSHQVDNYMRISHNMTINSLTSDYNFNSIKNHITALQIDKKLFDADTLFLTLGQLRHD